MKDVTGTVSEVEVAGIVKAVIVGGVALAASHWAAPMSHAPELGRVCPSMS